MSGVLLPRTSGPSSVASALVPTTTTTLNLKSLAEALLSSRPILVTGVSGSGKTELISEAARSLNAQDTMLTLHLNEQTDAKMLLGMYTTTTKPGSFAWKAGVLTTAVQEGRWVFIEDLDRAPTEVLGVILPLIERGELLIPSRGETIRAAKSFRLIATMRSHFNSKSEVVSLGHHMLGHRLWRRVDVQMPEEQEFRTIISTLMPLLHAHLPMIMAVYTTTRTLYYDRSFASLGKTSLGRPLSPRDLLKWCRRLNSLLSAIGNHSSSAPISESTLDDMFMEAADCFAGSLQTHDARLLMLSKIAESMQIAPQRVQYYLLSHIPQFRDSEKSIQIGRTRLRKRKTTGQEKGDRRPFAKTSHTLRLLESISSSVHSQEPVLLVGETGTGKTTIIQQLASSLNHKLTVVNLSQQSESGDLLGGFKPVNMRSLAIPLKDEFDHLFDSTFSAEKNQRFRQMLGGCVAKGKWKGAAKYWNEAVLMAEKRFRVDDTDAASVQAADGGQPKKKRRILNPQNSALKGRWQKFAQDLVRFEAQLSGGARAFAFTFIEGNIVKAARNGDWVLLDEINLASPDTLESIADLLHSGPGGGPSILLSETGDLQRIKAHPDFRIFGSMNPATDVGKKDLPAGLRSRFTEIYVESPDRDVATLLDVVKAYLGTSNNRDAEKAAVDISELYLAAKRLAEDNRLVDGANQKPHFSLRTLTRTLSYAVEIAPLYGLRRALYEGFSMSFLTLLDKESEKVLAPLIDKHLLGKNARSLLKQLPRNPSNVDQYVQIEHYWMQKGGFAVEAQPQYIITPFVKRNLLNLIRATSTRRFPVLVQGPTSSGKTSMIEYLAKVTGNKFVRINNHEHTDLQEYLGTYISGTDGQLEFQEGLLVEALRKGHWIVLDELNLAPTDVLEALNRLLDDNRELLIPETQEIIRPHNNFMLFATQNPPGLYGGRKVLSRAFRNRFLELHFDDIPENELETILRERSQIAPSYCKNIVNVYKELSVLRQSDRIFEQKNSFATLRDLFRWAMRKADNREELAANGLMLLAERVRHDEERQAVKKVIEKVLKVTIDEEALYDTASLPEYQAFALLANTHGVVWTGAMKRLFALVSHALRNNEPVLLVGETGCGKTTVCQMLAEAFGKKLHIVNAHQNTETGDLIGAQRPLRNRSAIEKLLMQDLSEVLSGHLDQSALQSMDLAQMAEAYDLLPGDALAKVAEAHRQRIAASRSRVKALFEWTDGSLVHAMKTGQMFLLDEISLADDSVLERLNSVLESQRTLLLAEKGVDGAHVTALDGFQFLATMNPGGDYGKRELSPALRNRFTEIWVPPVSDGEDILKIVNTKIMPAALPAGAAIVKFAQWFSKTYNSSSSALSTLSIRDILAWLRFIELDLSQCQNPTGEESALSILNGAAMVFIDTIGANPAAMLSIPAEQIPQERLRCLETLSSLLEWPLENLKKAYFLQVEVSAGSDFVQFGAFKVPVAGPPISDQSFSFQAPTTKQNGMRVFRALQLEKPILLEGNPGVGKTTLVNALANGTGRVLTRINLSEQTDIMDLFGSDVPVDGGKAGEFAWRDAPFLQAMQRGDWVLLDEMNLASQSVLEGLNACLDHRGEVYISELDQTFTRHPNFKVFAAQNPHHQGGGRKGLPASFVNRFTVVYADIFSVNDMITICSQSFPDFSSELTMKLIDFVARLEKGVSQDRAFGSDGSPWEFNLRDILRWMNLLTSKYQFLQGSDPADFLGLIFTQRFRNKLDKTFVERLFTLTFGSTPPTRYLYSSLSAGELQVGFGVLQRKPLLKATLAPPITPPKAQLPLLESLMICVQQSWPTILVGPTGCGKTTLIKTLASITGAELVELALNADVDTMDLVGGYEQVDPQRRRIAFIAILNQFISESFATLLTLADTPQKHTEDILKHLQLCANSKGDLNLIAASLHAIRHTWSSERLSGLISECQILQSEPEKVSEARFEWYDGVLIDAIRLGHWIVLDNANLCSSSVLDRLNSLMEPNGSLVVNEHRTASGDAVVVNPHPEFRIFLTMDPRHGELSRAMRNRAIELYVEMPEEVIPGNDMALSNMNLQGAEIDNYRILKSTTESKIEPQQWQTLVDMGLKSMTFPSAKMLLRWSRQVDAGLVTLSTEEASSLKMMVDRYSALNSGTTPIWSRVREYYSSLLSRLDSSQSGEWAEAQVSDRVFPVRHICTDTLYNTIANKSTCEYSRGLNGRAWFLRRRSLLVKHARSDFTGCFQDGSGATSDCAEVPQLKAIADDETRAIIHKSTHSNTLEGFNIPCLPVP
jgi:midasin